MRTTWTLALALALSVAGLVGFTPAPASAAGCYAAGCDFRDAGTNGCYPDSVVRSEMTIRYWRYKVMYSAACRAGWAEITANQWDCGPPYLHLQVRNGSASSSPVVSRRVTTTTCLEARQSLRTSMASFNNWLQTCASTLDNDIFPAGRCTGIV